GWAAHSRHESGGRSCKVGDCGWPRPWLTPSIRCPTCSCPPDRRRRRDPRPMPGLEDLYREIILDHYRNPRNRGELPAPPAKRVEGFNPLCGDEIVVYLDVDGRTIADVKVSGQGCSISQSSAS